MKVEYKVVFGQPVISSSTIYMYDIARFMNSSGLTEEESREMVRKGNFAVNGVVETNPDRVLYIDDQITKVDD